MVKNIFNTFGKEILGLHEAAYVLAGFAFLSTLLALLRDKLLAFTFGADHYLDIYYASFRIPDLLFVSIGSLVSASILLPFFIEKYERSNKDGESFSNQIFTLFFMSMCALSVIIFIFAPLIVPKIIPGFANDDSLQDLIKSVRIMLLSPFFLGLSNLFSSLTQMRHRFLVYAASPLVYNAGIIAGVLVAYPIFGITGLAWGVALGAFLHMGIQVPFLRHENLIPRFTTLFRLTDVRHVVYAALPRTITLSANQLASFFLISLASLMSVGSIAIFNFAFNLQSVPLTIIGASYSSAVFPTLSRLHIEKNSRLFVDKVIVSAQHIIFWSLPLAVLFIVLRAQIVRTVFGAGRFDWADTRLTAAALAVFCVSTLGQSLVTLFIRAFYAEGKTYKPLAMNAISAALIVISGYVFFKIYSDYPVARYFLEDLLKVSDHAGASVLVLSLAYSFGVMVNTIMHWCAFERAHAGFSKPVVSTLFHSFSASVIMGYAAYLGLRLFSSMFPLNKVWGIFMQGLLAGLLGIAVGIVVLVLLKNKELTEVWRALHKKIWRTPVAPAEIDHI